MATSVKVYSSFDGKATECREGNTLHHGRLDSINVPDGFIATIYDGPSMGGRGSSRPYYAGKYSYIRFSYSWLNGDSSKLIVVSPTKFEERELLELIWWARDGDKQRVQIQKLPPGKGWDARRNKDFQNDRVESIRVPKNSVATVYENSDEGGRYIKLQSGYHKTKDYDLYMKVSSIDFSLDDWKELDIILGAERNRKPRGKPVVETIKGTGAPGDNFTKSITLGNAVTKGTNWHASASVTASVTIKQGGGPAPGGVEESVSTTVEAGGGGDESKTETREVSVTINGIIGDSGRIEADVIGQLVDVDQQVFRRVQNVRTDEIAKIEGDTPAEKFDVTFSIRHGKIVESETKEGDIDGS